MKTGKLIVIEGIDGSGKATQAALLAAKLRKQGIRAEKLDFPQYQTFFGQLVARYLKNEFGRISPYVASLIYAANRFEARDKLISWLKQGKTVVLNRYTTSNLIHQTVDLSSRDQKKFMDWVQKMEYQVFGLPQPDVVVFLKMPVVISFALTKQKNKAAHHYLGGSKSDLLESDFQHQTEAFKQTLKLFRTLRQKTVQVDCTERGQILSKDQIADKVWQAVSKLVK